MALTKLQFRPGINREFTSYANEGGWSDGDKIRFHLGFPEKIGGWQKYSSAAYLGTARRLHNWVALDGSDYMGLGTNLKYYIEEGGAYNDITPIRSTTSAGDVTFAATNGSSTITVTDSNHGAVTGDFVTFSGAVSLGGDITAVVLNIEHELTVIDANTYTIDVSPFTANASDTGNGGSSTVGEYQINTGLNSAVGGTGWSAGLYGGTTSGALTAQLNGSITNSDTTITLTSTTGFPTSGTIAVDSELIDYTGVSGSDLTGCTRGVRGTTADSHTSGETVRLAIGNTNSSDDFFGWGQAASGGVTTQTELRLWSHDNFGEDLLINPIDSGIYYWDKTNTLSSRAVDITSLSGANKAPTIAKQILVSDLDRHVIAFACDPEAGGAQDNLLVRFSSQESLTDWETRSDNTAGSLRLGSGSTFVQAIETKREVLIWTDKSLHSMRFVGPPFTFGIQQLATNITIMGPEAAISTEDFVFWMGNDNFYVYAGQTTQLPCTVRDYVFLDFNFEQKNKVVCGVNSQWGEVIWYYPSASSQENDRYVIYNYLDKVWYYGNLSRTAWKDRGIRQYPIAAGENGGSSYLYNHEIGVDDDGSPMDSFIESSQMDMGDGDNFVLTRRLIPDLKFDGSSASNPVVDFTLQTRTYPGASYNQTETGAVTRTATTPVEQWTNELDMRLRGRSFSMKIESDDIGVRWKLGVPRVDLRPDGRR
jgi:hypothetical protein